MYLCVRVWFICCVCKIKIPRPLKMVERHPLLYDLTLESGENGAKGKNTRSLLHCHARHGNEFHPSSRGTPQNPEHYLVSCLDNLYRGRS